MIAIRIPKTTYSTISYARMMSVDMPFGDPHRGAPYGQKNGPAIALIGAYGAISGGITAGGLLGGIMIAGGVFSALGAITGNKTLSTIGMVAGLAGAVGTAFTASEAFASSAEGIAGGVTKGSFINPFSDAYKFGNTQMGAVFGDITKSLGIDVDSVATKATGVTDPASQALTGASDIPKGINYSGATDFAAPGTNAIGESAANLANSAGGAASAATKSTGLLSSLSNNKGAMDLAGGLANGYNEYQRLEQQQPLVDQQVNLYEARADTERFALEKSKQQQANMQNQNAPIASVDPNSSIFTQAAPQQQKIAVNINGAVRYVTQAEFDAYRAQQQPQSGGLLQQGATA